MRYVSRQTVAARHALPLHRVGRPGARRRSLLLHGGNQSSHSWDLVSLHLSDRFHVYALDQRGHGDTEWSRELDYSMDAMAADAAGVHRRPGARAADRVRALDGRPGHAAGRCSHDPTSPGPSCIVDVGPELSAKGAKMIGDFIAHNIEFDDLDVFLDNVVRYDRFRTREHIARTVKYNMLRRADGKYVSKVDHRRLPGTMRTDHARAASPPSPARCCWCAAASPTSCCADAAERFVDALPDGRLVTVPDVGHNVHGGQHARASSTRSGRSSTRL